MTKTEIGIAALDRAQSGESLTNYPAIFEGFAAKGIPESEIVPRENVLTFNAWLAKGRVVRKGQHGVKVVTFVEMRSAKRDDDQQRRSYRRPSQTTVFHISQTDPLPA